MRRSGCGLNPAVRRAFLFFVSLAATPAFLVGGQPSERPEAIVVVAGDLHSAYERTAQFVARIDRLAAENSGVPLAVLINGDALEYGNAIARRSGGAVDFAMFRALATRAPTIVNLGNHEADFHAVPDAVARLRETGVTVISANACDRASGAPFAPPATELKLGPHTAVVVGLMTDRLNTFRLAVRPALELREPAAWAEQHLGSLLRDATLPIVLSHSGMRADRGILPQVPDGTLFAGAHDHLRFIHRSGRTVYFHSGSWLEFVSVARLHRVDGVPRWEIEAIRLEESDPRDPQLAALIREMFARHLTAEESKVVGRAPKALGPSEAAQFAVEAARAAAEADVALIGGTTFGAGLPAGNVTRFALDACVRFDGTLWHAEVEGARLQRILARANQGPDTPFAARGGENLVAVARVEVLAGKTYRFVTTDWIAKNPKDYLGDDPPPLAELPTIKLKAAVIAALNP